MKLNLQLNVCLAKKKKETPPVLLYMTFETADGCCESINA